MDSRIRRRLFLWQGAVRRRVRFFGLLATAWIFFGLLVHFFFDFSLDKSVLLFVPFAICLVVIWRAGWIIIQKVPVGVAIGRLIVLAGVWLVCGFLFGMWHWIAGVMGLPVIIVIIDWARRTPKEAGEKERGNVDGHEGA